VSRNLLFHLSRKIAPARGLKSFEHSRMSTEKLHLQNILVPDIGQNVAIINVSSV
jgi:hypothetical protein